MCVCVCVMGAMRHADVDVVVVGAGLSGLTAATCLAGINPAQDASSCAVLAGLPPLKPSRIVVVEASNRVGGRTCSTVSSTSGLTYELGGQWIGPTHSALRELADGLRVHTHAQHYDGTRIMDLDGVISTYNTGVHANARTESRTSGCIPSGLLWML